MVLLTMTPSIVEGLKSLPNRPDEEPTKDVPETQTETTQAEPSLAEPAVGKPISHGQIVDLWKSLRASGQSSTFSLEHLLHGAHVYIPPPPPKPEPTPEYKALMARLRREEEARSYERMLNPQHQPHSESFYERFPHASARAFAAVNQPISAADTGDDDGVTYNDVHRQVLLIINFLVSILGVAGTLWVAARWWSLPARLFLTMGGSAVVAVAEVAVYSIYVWKLGEAKQRSQAVKEIGEVVETWVAGEGEKGEGEKVVLLESKEEEEDTDGVRRRTATTKEMD
ncbi:hypothetical protein ACRE_008500 [Hapsidospora chrysogenum ATCC 11550]|uniref:Uncharacterized protein n=1 Tax=Hapsidospora chrysogenum (strain ATCC 11550 / CBS 779.69 / DSM 880 / IAM 14645 / JCM 23072 / IMI 49137) TaxID=857340 RepID=A0A086TG78_HAPC1|nr:hypothetical protein ACRE_008500 [Hapsidospora chrysogenum ATCC 11550]